MTHPAVRATRAATAALVLLASAPAGAESYVSLVGNYYKERSTRVAAPALGARYELPDDWRVQGGFLVDQITSASGAFTATDEPFTEYRYEASAVVDKRFGAWRPGLFLKYSDESDYTSRLVGAATSWFLNQDLTVLSVALQYQWDDVSRRTTDQSGGARQQGQDQFRDELETVYLSFDLAQTLRPNLVAGLSTKVEVMRGFLENVYRQEQHPRAREDYSLGGFLRYYHRPWRLGVLLEECVHVSSWDHWGISSKLQLTYAATPWLVVVPMVRWYEQPVATFFGGSNGAEVPDPNDPGSTIFYMTRDPTLEAHRTVQIGAMLSFEVDALWDARVQPSYYYLHQSSRYGTGHVAQLALYVPL